LNEIQVFEKSKVYKEMYMGGGQIICLSYISLEIWIHVSLFHFNQSTTNFQGLQRLVWSPKKQQPFFGDWHNERETQALSTWNPANGGFCLKLVNEVKAIQSKCCLFSHSFCRRQYYLG